MFSLIPLSNKKKLTVQTSMTSSTRSRPARPARRGRLVSQDHCYLSQSLPAFISLVSASVYLSSGSEGTLTYFSSLLGRRSSTHLETFSWSKDSESRRSFGCFLFSQITQIKVDDWLYCRKARNFLGEERRRDALNWKFSAFIASNWQCFPLQEVFN